MVEIALQFPILAVELSVCLRFSDQPLIPPFASYAFSSLLFTPTLLLSDLSLPLFVASLGMLSGSPLLPFFSSPLCSPFFPFFPFPLSTPSQPPFYSSSSPSFLFRLSSPRPPLSFKVFAQSGSAQRGSTFRSITPSGRLPPCRELLELAPPMIFSYLRAPFLCAAYGSSANYVDGCCGPPATCLLLGTLLTT